MPLWLASLLAMFLVMFARALAQPVVRFWSDPPVRGSAYDYYGYYRGHSRRTGNAQIVPFALPAAVEPELEKSAA